MIGTDTDEIAAGIRRVRRALLIYSASMGALTLYAFVGYSLCGVDCRAIPATLIGVPALVALLILSLATTIKLVRRDAITLWTPAFVFPLGTGLFMGFGPLSTFLSTEATRAYLLSGTYPVDPGGIIRTLLLTTIGVTVCTFAMRTALQLRVGSGNRVITKTRRNRLSPSGTAIFFLTCGAVLKYGFVLPETYGISSIEVPGTLKSMTSLVDLGFAVMAYLAARGNRTWLLIFFILWPFHLGLTALEFKKRMLLFAILLPAAGAYLAHGNWRRLIPWALAAVLAYGFTQNINTTARNVILEDTGTINQADFGARLSIMNRIISGDLRLEDLTSNTRTLAQVWWLRLNYAGPQLQAMQLYDRGTEGEWTLSLARVFVPRLLWPEKPPAPQEGLIFNRIVTGYELAHARVGITVYADGYWKYGWLGVVLFSAIMGLILGAITRYNYRAVAERRLIALPVILLGMVMAGLGPTNFLQKAIVGPLGILLGYMLLVFLIERTVRALRNESSGRPSRNLLRLPRGELV